MTRLRRPLLRASVLVAVAGLLLVFPGRTLPAAPLRLRVLSYNIHHARGVDGVLDLSRIARVINSVSPDLVAVQEVDRGAERTGGMDQPAELARLTGMRALFERNIELQGGEYGNAVLSRLPVRWHWNHLLPSFDGGEQRGVLEAEVALPAGAGPLRFLATHLDHRRDHQERLTSSLVIRELCRPEGTPPALLAGDLNATPESPVLQEIFRSWQDPGGGAPRPTIPVDRPTRQIDYVLCRPADRWRAVEVRVLDEPVASDHRPILAVLEFLPPPAP